MQPHATSANAAGRHRPKTLTVFAAAFAAGAVLAYGVNRVVDVHVVQVEPQVESEPIFVALRSLPQGSPVTVWDVALKDWPKAMLPTTALKADASLEGMILRHPVREGQPLLSVQLVRDGAVPLGATLAALPAAAAPAAEQFIAAPPAEPAPASRPATPASPPEQAAEQTANQAPVAAVAEPGTAVAEASAPAIVSGTATPVNMDVATVTHDLPATTAKEPGSPFVAAGSTTAEEPTTSLMSRFLAPSSTDVDEREPVPAVAAPSGDAPTVATADAPVPLPNPTPVPMPTPLHAPTPVAVNADPVTPLVAPVPALPSTDLEGPLAHVGKVRPAPPTTTASVLDRTAAAAPPATTARLPRHHLVIPERIALAADASFTQPRQPQQQQQTAPGGDRTARVAPPSRDAAATGTAGPTRSGSRQPMTTKPSGRKQQPVSPPGAKPQQSSPRGLNAWLPQVSGGRQR